MESQCSNIGQKLRFSRYKQSNNSERELGIEKPVAEHQYRSVNPYFGSEKDNFDLKNTKKIVSKNELFSNEYLSKTQENCKNTGKESSANDWRQSNTNNQKEKPIDQSGNLSEILEKDYLFKIPENKKQKEKELNDEQIQLFLNNEKNSGSRKSRLSVISVDKNGATATRNFLGIEIEKDSIERILLPPLPDDKKIKPFQSQASLIPLYELQGQLRKSQSNQQMVENINLKVSIDEVKNDMCSHNNINYNHSGITQQNMYSKFIVESGEISSQTQQKSQKDQHQVFQPRRKQRSPTRNINEWSPNPYSPSPELVDRGLNYPEYPTQTTLETSMQKGLINDLTEVPSSLNLESVSFIYNYSAAQGSAHKSTATDNIYNSFNDQDLNIYPCLSDRNTQSRISQTQYHSFSPVKEPIPSTKFIDLHTLLKKILLKNNPIITYDLQIPYNRWKEDPLFKKRIIEFFNISGLNGGYVEDQANVFRNNDSIYWMKKFRSKESKIQTFFQISNFHDNQKKAKYSVLKCETSSCSVFSTMDNRSRKRIFTSGGYPLGAKKAKMWVMKKRHIYTTPKNYQEPENPNTERPCLFFLNENCQFLHFYDCYQRMHLNVFTVRHADGSLATILDFKINNGELFVLTDTSITVFKLSDFSIKKEVNVIDEVLAMYYIGSGRLLLVPKSGNLLEIYDLEREQRKFIVFDKEMEPNQVPVLQSSQENKNLSCLMLKPDDMLYIVGSNYRITEIDLALELSLH